MAKDLHILLTELDNLWSNFTNCRAHFPALSETLLGKSAIPSAPYYIKRGFNVTICLSEPLDKEKYNKIHSIGHWINQNFIIRLSALFESYQIYSEKIDIDFNLQGSHLTNIVRRLEIVLHTLLEDSIQIMTKMSKL